MSGSNGGLARKRLSLFAGGSLAAASIAAAGGLMLAPTAALAANECGDPTLNGPTADVFSCTGTQGAITYPVVSGNLTLTLTNGVTVTTGGIVVTATGTDAVLINRSDVPAGTGDPSITSTSGAGIQVTTATGAATLTLSDGDFTGDTPITVTGTTAGVQLQSGGTTGNVVVLATQNGSITATAAGGVGVQATTTSLTGGNIQLNIGGAVSGATGVRATTSGTGGMSVNLTGVSTTIAGGDVVGTNGPAMQLSPNANLTMNINAGRVVRAANASGAVIEVTTINATRFATISLNGGIVRSNDAATSGYDDLALRVAGGGGGVSIFGNAATPTTSTIQGRLSLLNTGSVNFTNAGIWRTVGASTLGAGTGAATLTNSGVLVSNAGAGATSLAFGDGADILINSGKLAVGGEGAQGAATLTLTGLETWNNSGVVLFGADVALADSDGTPNDRVVSSGAATVFTGSATSQLVMDVNFASATAQTSCAAAVVADCLDLTGGRTAGVTTIVVRSAGSGIGVYNPGLVLVDVSGGTSIEEDFVLAQTSAGWRADINARDGVIDTGLFAYTLMYDPDTQRHVLLSAPDTEALQFPLFGQAAQSVWRTSTGGWLDRQADLRDGLEAPQGVGGGVWLKVAGNFTDRVLFQDSRAGTALEYNNSYEQRSQAIVGGIDLLGAAGPAGAWVVGVTAGALDSEMTFKASPTELSMDGHSLGAYASYLSGSLFVDAIVSANTLELDYAGPTLGAGGAAGSGEVTSFGYQVEAGWRLPINDADAFLEPLAAVSYVSTDFGGFVLPGAALSDDDFVSLRAALGLRVAGDVETGALAVTYAVTGRIWEETEGQNAINVSGADLLDDTSGSLGDVGVGLGFRLKDGWGGLSAFVNYAVTFRDDYQSTNAALGARYQW